jgi:8-oxo-dGTP pyrophosphatase MutT (NUDIX family)
MNQKKPTRRPKPNNTPPKQPRSNKATREFTAGGMVWRKVRDEFQILMIQDRMGRWTIPKGHVEEGEGKLIFMTTYVFLIEATGDSDAVVPEDSEGIADVKWFPADEAVRLVEYRDTERLFRIGMSLLRGERRRSSGHARRRRRRRTRTATAGGSSQ